MSQSTYDDFSHDYDRFVNWEARLAAELPFVRTFLTALEKETRERPCILDAACGSGMHAIALAAEGYNASGADFSPGMIAKARENALQAGAHMSFKAAPFGSLAEAFRHESPFPFDLIMCLGNSLPHLLSSAHIHSALLDLAACLRPGGCLILQNRNFDAIMDRKERWIAPQSRQVGDGEWIFLRFYDFDPDGLITFNIVRLHRINKDGWQQKVSTTRLYPLKEAEMLNLLQESGFTRVERFGLMADEPFDPSSSENLVIVARKT